MTADRDDGRDRDRDRDAVERRLRLRAFLADRRGAVAVALVVLVLAGGWLAGTAHVAPGTTTEERVASSWERTSTFSHAATVRRSVGAFDRGRRLENRSVYFSRAAPVLDVRYAVGYAATGDGRLDADVRLRLVRRALAGEGGDAGGGGSGSDGVLWRTERVLATRNVTGLRPGRTVVVPASVNVTAVDARTDELVAELGASPGTTEVAVVADVRLDGRVNGRATERTFTHEVGLSASEGTYRVTGRPRARDREETTRVVAVERTYGPLRRVGGPLLVAVGLLGLVGLRVARSRGAFAVGPDERDWLAYRDDRSEYDEWIHAVDLPSEVEALPRARADSLADLVDLAIDADAAVLESPDGREYRVVHDGYRYVYEAPPAPDRRPRTGDTAAATPDSTDAPGALADDEPVDATDADGTDEPVAAGTTRTDGDAGPGADAVDASLPAGVSDAPTPAPDVDATRDAGSRPDGRGVEEDAASGREADEEDAASGREADEEDEGSEAGGTSGEDEAEGERAGADGWHDLRGWRGDGGGRE